jgi:amino acid transporter
VATQVKRELAALAEDDPPLGHRVGLVISGRVLRLELRLEQRRDARFSRHIARHCSDVHDVHFQLYRTDDGDPACWWTVRLMRGGPSDRTAAYLAGIATLVEFVFAPPAIALAIGAYLNVQFPALNAKARGARRLRGLHVPQLIGVSIAATL